MLKRCLLALAVLLPLAACSGQREDLKSPCVGAAGSPCGPHRPVNDSWLS